MLRWSIVAVRGRRRQLRGSRPPPFPRPRICCAPCNLSSLPNNKQCTYYFLPHSRDSFANGTSFAVASRSARHLPQQVSLSLLTWRHCWSHSFFIAACFWWFVLIQLQSKFESVCGWWPGVVMMNALNLHKSIPSLEVGESQLRWLLFVVLIAWIDNSFNFVLVFLPN